MIEGTICLQCGDKGFENALVHCVRCLKFAVHRYCLDNIPDTFDEFVCWFCDDCKVKVGNQSAVFERDAIPCQTRHHKVSKNIKRSSRDEKEKNSRVIDENEHVRKDELDGKHDANATLLLGGASENVEGNLECRIATTSYDECVKVGTDECTNSASDSTIPCIVKENGCSEQKDQEEKMIESKKKRKRPRKKNIMELMTEKDQHRLGNTPYDECVKENGCSEQKDQEKEKKKIKYKKTKVRQRQRKRTQAMAEKEQHRLATTTYNEHTKVDINEGGIRQGNDSTLPPKVKVNEGCEQRGDDQEKKKIKNRKTKVRQRQRTQNKMGSTIAKVQHRLHTTTYDEHIKVDINEGIGPGIDSTLPSSMKENESCEQKDQTKPFKSITDHPVILSDGASKSLSEKKKVLRTGFAQPLHAKELADLSPEEKDLGSSDGRIKSRGPEDKVEQISTSQQSKDKYVDYSVAQPIAMPVWRGSFNVRNSKHDSIDELVAHISNKACHMVYAEASQFQPILHLEMLPKSDIWPKSFQTSEPNSDSIALYFFPSKIRNQVFAQLVQEMIHKELAFKGLVQNAELLIFTSTELPLRYWRFQNKYYLWGVFREKPAAPSNHPSCIG
ncbi:uncharacterized protein LOC125218855 isoform X2 [Salvia hispanica]|uniref:uncharacterized protein LOC125218855 isoform X2 n=1 Tax=Salvia hispanica TaxID=49212 RepID=UPI002008F483|nr:uncharacterized protein LOC125218855 isoform X2 [Salvia hispanica]